MEQPCELEAWGVVVVGGDAVDGAGAGGGDEVGGGLGRKWTTS